MPLAIFVQEGVASSLKLCQVCGCRGPLSCGNCKRVSYCSASHQKIDWTLGEHKGHCKSDGPTRIGNERHAFLLDEFDLVTEPEEAAPSDSDDEDDEESRLQDYEDYVRQHEPASDLKDVPDEEFDKYAGQCDDDNGFRKFKKRIAGEPEQVRRLFCSTSDGNDPKS